jgi:16S rRNA C967 or C1407 C5-methylase (RsmB/RsmF family)
LNAENAAIIAGFLHETADARDITRRIVGESDKELTGTAGYRIAAGTDAMDGFYYACLEKDRR